MNIREADESVLNGQWSEIVEELAEACLRYRDSGTLVKGSLLYDKWTARAELLKEVSEL